MKTRTKFYSIAIALAVSFSVLSSCVNNEKFINDKQLYTVCLQLKKDIELLPFPSAKSIPDYLPPEPRSSDELNDGALFSQIEYVVFHKESGSIIKQQVFTGENSDDFGDYIYDELETGNYIVALLAHSASGLELIGNDVNMSEMSDSFHAVKEITVGPESENEIVGIVLKRIVARVKFVSSKPAPENVWKFILQITEQYNRTNIKTGEVITSQFLQKEYLLSGGHGAEDQPAHFFYTFVPDPLLGDTSFLSHVKLATLSLDEDTLYKIDLMSVPVIKNRITRYTGNLYSPYTNTNTLDLEIEDYGLWKDTIDIPVR